MAAGQETARVEPSVVGRLDADLLARVARRALRCSRCGYGVVAAGEPPRCPMCGAASWKALDPNPWSR